VPIYVTTSAAARALGVNRVTLTRAVKAGRITPASTTPGGHYRWDIAALKSQWNRLRNNGDTTAEDIASVIHDANRRLQIIRGDPEPSPPWDEAPEYQARQCIDGVIEVLRDPALTPAGSHEKWNERMLADGWSYGEVKDPEAKTHPCLLPFEELPWEQQQKDRLFIAIVRALSGGGPA
jgi:RyR domain